MTTCMLFLNPDSVSTCLSLSHVRRHETNSEVSRLISPMVGETETLLSQTHALCPIESLRHIPCFGQTPGGTNRISRPSPDRSCPSSRTRREIGPAETSFSKIL